MFERILKRRFHIARHHAAPFSKERQLYLAHLISEGRARLTLKSVCDLLLIIMRYLPSCQPLSSARRGWKPGGAEKSTGEHERSPCRPETKTSVIM